MGFEVTMPDLSEFHRKMLYASNITDQVIAARGYRTITDGKDLRDLGFSYSQTRTPGLLIPLWTPSGEQFSVYRPDNPRVIEDMGRREPDGTYHNKVIKYEFPKGARLHLDCPPMARNHLKDPHVPLWITEGQKKADSLVSQGLCAIALLGVWSWRGANDLGGKTVLADWDYIALNGRDLRIIFDSDVMQKPEVQKALTALIRMLSNRHASVKVVYLPSEPGLGKVGVDDWLFSGHTLDELESLVEAPRLSPPPPTPLVELLDDAPKILSRPLSLIDGNAYAAAWLNVRVTITESVDKKGTRIRHDPPIMNHEKRLFIIRGDGKIIQGGETTSTPPDLEIHFSEELPPGKGWSNRGFKAYVSGKRPNPVDVFEHVRATVDAFIDFDHSLADQRTMTEFIACYILHTYFLDAFNVTGFLWPNGEKGSGKTQLLVIITELAYLGILVISGGTFASLRDLADYGATIGFDDAEGLSDSKKTDPDKRALLLAGNRRGTTVPLKEPSLNGSWKTRYVNAFCPRLFSATQLPDPILSSRTIIVPLLRTPDAETGNRDPKDYNLWPYDRQELIDDLWAVALQYLPTMPSIEKISTKESGLVGRDLDPWRGILTIAEWLDQQGVTRLWERMKNLSHRYQFEKSDLEVSDLTTLIIKVLLEMATRTIRTIRAINGNTPLFITVATQEIAKKAIDVSRTDELDFEDGYLSPKRIGRLMKSLRFEKLRDSVTKARQWKIKISELERLARSYGLSVPNEITPMNGGANSIDNGSNGLNGPNDETIFSETIGDDGTLTLVEDAEPNSLQSINLDFHHDDITTTLEPYPDISRPCFACHHIAWQERPLKAGGGYFCSVCHPSIADQSFKECD